MAMVPGPSFDARKEAEKHFAAACAEQRAPLPAYRYFDTLDYEQFHQKNAWAAQRRIEYFARLEARLQASIPSQKEVKKQASTTMQAMRTGRSYFDFASGTTHADKLRFFLDDPEAENVMISDENCGDACADALVVPWADICSDVIGANSLFPYYLSAEQDSSAWDIGGWTVWVNPPYKWYAPLVAWLE